MSLDRIAGNGGTYFLESSTAHTGHTFSQIYVGSDAVFTTLTITDTAGSTYSALSTKAVVPQYGQNLSGRTVKAGTLLTAPQGSWFSAVTMSSGDAVGIITRNR